MLITTREQLADWFDDESWFDDGHLYSWSPPPTDRPPAEVTLELGHWVSGGRQLGDEMGFDCFRVTARGVIDYSIGPPGHRLDHWSQGIELIDDGLGFTMDIPGLLRIEFRELAVARLDDRRVRVEPKVSEGTIWATSATAEPLSAEKWVEGLEGSGLNATWNFCGDDEVLANHFPGAEHRGWCIELLGPNGLHEVVLVRCVRGLTSGYSVIVRRRGPRGPLWEAICHLAAGENDALVRTGNLEMTGDEWRRYLADGVLPDQPHGPTEIARSWRTLDDAAADSGFHS